MKNSRLINQHLQYPKDASECTPKIDESKKIRMAIKLSNMRVVKEFEELIDLVKEGFNFIRK